MRRKGSSGRRLGRWRSRCGGFRGARARDSVGPGANSPNARPDAAFRQANNVGNDTMNDFGAESSRPASSLCTLQLTVTRCRCNTRCRPARYGSGRAGLPPAGFH